MSCSKLGYHSISSNYGYYIDKTPHSVLNALKTPIEELQKDFSKGIKYNKNLAGEIENEFFLTSPYQLTEYLKVLTDKIEFHSGYISRNYNKFPDKIHEINLTSDDLWVNFQKKYEYNPMHNHSGVYSFVIWYQIPFLLEQEIKRNKYIKNGTTMHGQFVFYAPQTGSRNSPISYWNLDIDKTKEGYIAIFPSDLNHLVYPFYTSNDYRITIAGNIFTIDENKKLGGNYRN